MSKVIGSRWVPASPSDAVECSSSVSTSRRQRCRCCATASRRDGSRGPQRYSRHAMAYRSTGAAAAGSWSRACVRSCASILKCLWEVRIWRSAAEKNEFGSKRKPSWVKARISTVGSGCSSPAACLRYTRSTFAGSTRTGLDASSARSYGAMSCGGTVAKTSVRRSSFGCLARSASMFIVVGDAGWANHRLAVGGSSLSAGLPWCRARRPRRRALAMAAEQACRQRRHQEQ
mmetsp:Transcript_9562/g.28235  ORF Transcript_9562/g.28235 Transcript_9562/m.28235 type:complete len:231 (+) Transcript_9562:1009-1701(+)